MLNNEEIEETLNEDEDINEKISNEIGDSEKKEKVNKQVENKDVEDGKKSKDDNKPDETTVIEKIKEFITKIVAMQEEAAKEFLADEEIEEKFQKIKQEKDDTTKYLLEYYDLPYRYNETTVKILAQTPKRLFVYWDISDNDRNKYIETFGEDFFNTTYPVLLLYNEDMKYVKEIPINDFANSWYIDIDNPKTKYTIQLGRKFKNKPDVINIAKLEENNIVLKTDYMPFANSNTLEAPNDHVLLEYLPNLLTFRNVKTNEEFVKDISKFKDAYGNNYNVKDFYGEQYKDELEEGMFDMANPSSNLSSSSFK